MNCPLCKSTELHPAPLDEGPVGHGCPDCGGVWVQSADYQEWLGRHGPTLPENADAETPYSVEDSPQAKLCPHCRHLLTRYKVGHALDFCLEHCGHCQGVWFDRHEWDSLKARNLHDEVHRVFTEAWQRGVRQEEQRRAMQAHYRRRFGEEDYEEARHVRAWLDAHPEREALLAYLGNPNPYAP